MNVIEFLDEAEQHLGQAISLFHQAKQSHAGQTALEIAEEDFPAVKRFLDRLSGNLHHGEQSVPDTSAGEPVPESPSGPPGPPPPPAA